jgi:hypothetical protein
MQKSPYFFEIEDLLIQFLAAFNNVVIKRFNEKREIGQTLQVRYVYAPKQRVIYDIVNAAQNITLPVVSVHMTNFRRDESRVFNKNGGFYKPNSVIENNKTQITNFYRTPVPVNISITMDILVKYQKDLDQIMSNFIPFCNPYIILSWKVPEKYNIPFVQEIRSEVLWNGDVNVTYPTDINGNQKYFITGSTSFTIKGWIFPSEEDPINNIFFIDAALIAAKGNLKDSTYFELNSQVVKKENCSEYYNTEIISISAAPQMSDVFFQSDGMVARANSSVIYPCVTPTPL